MLRSALVVSAPIQKWLRKRQKPGAVGGVGRAEARDVQEDEDRERHEERGRADQHLEQAGDQADHEHVERADPDEGEDRPERAGVGAEAEAADQVGERRDQDATAAIIE